MTSQITFDDGAGYEEYMGVWSRLVADRFLDWLAPESGHRWLDVGCGNGAFTALVAERCRPSHVDGLDPSPAQLSFARGRLSRDVATFHQGDAMALPFPDGSFDVAVMPLVIFFVPEPTVGVAEMRRVLGPAGSAAAYAWDMEAGGFPYHVLQAEMRTMGCMVPQAPSPQASRLDVLQSLWADAGFRDIATQTFIVERTFDNLDAYWNTVMKGPSVKGQLAAMDGGTMADLRTRVSRLLRTDSRGRVVCTAAANAVRGMV